MDILTGCLIGLLVICLVAAAVRVGRRASGNAGDSGFNLPSWFDFADGGSDNGGGGDFGSGGDGGGCGD